jgi:type II secretory pathway pseudopilin PulG
MRILFLHGWQSTNGVSHTSHKSGLTLVEILVVIVIIVGLVALLLPAVQRARESGRRAVCESNLHQIGLAIREYMQGYHQVPKLAPPNSVGGWMIEILPFLEGKALAESLTANPSLDPGTMSPLTHQRPAIFTCPSAMDGESTIPKVPVAQYIRTLPPRVFVADAPFGCNDPWIISPEMPPTYLQSPGPHNGGYNVLSNAESVGWQPSTANP